MSLDRSLSVSPIRAGDIPAVSAFLHDNLNGRLEAEEWAAAMVPSWPTEEAEHGFALRDGSTVVGAYLAFYSKREISGVVHRVCNLAAWCVQEEYRASSLRLLRAMLGQKGYTFTDLSPSGNVVPINTRLGFKQLDTSTAAVLNLPWPVFSRRARVVTDLTRIESLLRGEDLEIFLSHRGARAARHVVILVRGKPCYVIFRRDRRKRLPLFASVLYVGDQEAFRSGSAVFFRHLLFRRGIPMTLAELRIVGFRPHASLMLRTARPRMFRSNELRPDQIDYLYSELTSVAW